MQKNKTSFKKTTSLVLMSCAFIGLTTISRNLQASTIYIEKRGPCVVNKDKEGKRTNRLSNMEVCQTHCTRYKSTQPPEIAFDGSGACEKEWSDEAEKHSGSEPTKGPFFEIKDCTCTQKD